MPLFASSELVFIIGLTSFCNKGAQPSGLWIGEILQFCCRIIMEEEHGCMAAFSAVCGRVPRRISPARKTRETA